MSTPFYTGHFTRSPKVSTAEKFHSILDICTCNGQSRTLYVHVSLNHVSVCTRITGTLTDTAGLLNTEGRLLLTTELSTM